MADDPWQEAAKGLLRGSMKQYGIGYRELAALLTENGSPETERNLSNKISRGSFTAAFMVQCLVLMGVQMVAVRPARPAQKGD